MVMLIRAVFALSVLLLSLAPPAPAAAQEMMEDMTPPPLPIEIERALASALSIPRAPPLAAEGKSFSLIFGLGAFEGSNGFALGGRVGLPPLPGFELSGALAVDNAFDEILGRVVVSYGVK